MTENRFNQQVEFVIEADKLKEIIRRSYLFSESRKENSAEHSWHAALTALLLSEHYENTIDINRAIKMLLIHDIVEIDAGDTYIYDEKKVCQKANNEQKAAERLFTILPADQAEMITELWQEYEAKETSEARFAYCIDRIMPLIHNVKTKGRSWREHGITADQVFALFEPMYKISGFFYNYAVSLINEAIAKKYLEQK